MYYPESNVLVPKAADPLSRTPAYKSIPVTLAPDDATVAAPRPAARTRRRRHARETR